MTKLAEIKITVVVTDDLDDDSLDAAAEIVGERMYNLQEALAAELRNKFGSDKITSVDLSF